MRLFVVLFTCLYTTSATLFLVFTFESVEATVSTIHHPTLIFIDHAQVPTLGKHTKGVQRNVDISVLDILFVSSLE